MTLTVGRISYLNAVPFFHHLEQTGFAGCVVEGVPSDLNAALAAGRLDLSPSSSFEYARCWRDYLLLPGFSISSCGPVRSVLLFTREPLDAVARGEIALTGESATSVNLLKILLKEWCGADEVRCRVPEGPVEEVIASGGSALLIGDRALREATRLPAGMQTFDLGELWQRQTGLPFVFGLWIVRRAAFRQRGAEIRRFGAQLARALELAFADLEGMAAAVTPSTPLDAGELVAYWQSVSYGLSAQHLAGLERFFALCVRHRLLDEMPALDFVA